MSNQTLNLLLQEAVTGDRHLPELLKLGAALYEPKLSSAAKELALIAFQEKEKEYGICLIELIQPTYFRETLVKTLVSLGQNDPRKMGDFLKLLKSMKLTQFDRNFVTSCLENFWQRGKMLSFDQITRLVGIYFRASAGYLGDDSYCQE